MRSGGILIIRQLIFALETRLNFVDDAEVADEFGAARIDKMCLAIGALVDLGGREIGDTRLLPRKTGEGSEGQEHGAKRNAAIGEALRIDAAEPCANGGPTGDGFARAEGFIENVVNEARVEIAWVTLETRGVQRGQEFTCASNSCCSAAERRPSR